MNTSIKIILSLIIGLALAYPYLNTSLNPSGTLDTIDAAGVIPIIIITICFLALVALYCRSLQKCLTLLSPESRVCAPRSVWLMFLLPYNFIEDFFIVLNISDSVINESRINSKLGNISDFGKGLGLGWCIAQVLSIFPGIIGQIAGLFCFICWIGHWWWVIKINSLLKQ